MADETAVRDTMVIPRTWKPQFDYGNGSDEQRKEIAQNEEFVSNFPIFLT
jgi:hypothetical protein